MTVEGHTRPDRGDLHCVGLCGYLLNYSDKHLKHLYTATGLVLGCHILRNHPVILEMVSVQQNSLSSQEIWPNYNWILEIAPIWFWYTSWNDQRLEKKNSIRSSCNRRCGRGNIYINIGWFSARLSALLIHARGSKGMCYRVGFNKCPGWCWIVKSTDSGYR